MNLRFNSVIKFDEDYLCEIVNKVAFLNGESGHQRNQSGFKIVYNV